MKRRKVLAVLLAAAAMVSAFAGCSGNGGSTVETAGITENTPEVVKTSENKDLTPLGKYDEPITITTAKVSMANPHFPEGKSSSISLSTSVFSRL